MIHHRHIEELDSAVRLARRAVSTQHVEDPDRLSSVLHERWYLGLTSQQAEVPAPAPRAWRAWGPTLDRRASTRPAPTRSGCT